MERTCRRNQTCICQQTKSLKVNKLSTKAYAGGLLLESYLPRSNVRYSGLGFCGKTQFTALEKMHARAARIIHRLDWNLSSHDVMLKTDWKTLMDTYKQRLLITFYKCSNNEAPEKLCRNIMGTKNKNLRGEETAVIQRPQTEFLHASVTFRGAVLWNKLPAKIKNERNYERFQKVIKQIELDQMDFCTYNNNKDEICLYE